MKNTDVPPNRAYLYNMIYIIKVACTLNLNFSELHILIYLFLISVEMLRNQ